MTYTNTDKLSAYLDNVMIELDNKYDEKKLLQLKMKHLVSRCSYLWGFYDFAFRITLSCEDKGQSFL